MNDYASFLKAKGMDRRSGGFKPLWMPDFLFPFQSQLVDWSIRLGRAALFEDCVAAETIVHSPDGDERIDVLAERGQPIRVWTLDNGKPKAIWASSPWVNGFDRLYRLTFTSGRTLTASGRHRVLSPSGWKPVCSLRIGETLLVSDVSRLQSNWELCPSTPLSGARSFGRTVPSFPVGCPADFDSCGGQLLAESGNDRSFFPSPGDAQQPDRFSLRLDGLERRSSRTLCKRNAHLSMRDSCCRDDSTEEVAGFHAHASAASPNSYSIQNAWRFGEDTNPSRLTGGLPSLEEKRYEDGPSENLLEIDTLLSIHYIRDDWFYDLEVPGTENYLANGIWSHNCGLGKTPQQLVWATNVILKAGKKSRVLILAPLAVGKQTCREAKKFGMVATHVRDGELADGINVTNYEQLVKYRPQDFAGLVCDESGILKSAAGKYRKQAIAFANQVPYCLLCTATPSPNDFMELGGSAEALGVMTKNQMLAMFFTNDGDTTQQWSLKGHAKKRFWQWVASWARAVRKPSDLGFEDGKFELPPLNVVQHSVPSAMKKIGIFPPQARTLDAVRAECRRTLQTRCERMAAAIPKKGPALVWCHLNPEGDLLTELIPGAIQVAGCDPDHIKEERLLGFIDGKYRVLVSKPKLAGFGLNFQHCSEVGYFPSFSHEAYYQAVRRCWRFGQKNPVNVHMVASESCKSFSEAMVRKERQSIELFDGVVREMNSVLQVKRETNGHLETELPAWLIK